MQRTHVLPHSSQMPRHARAIAGTILAAATVATAACGSDSNENTVPPVATTITANSGSSGQTGAVGTALASPISVHVVDQNGAAMVGAAVTWTPTLASGSVQPTTSTTDASGNATTAWTLGSIVGTDSLTAAVGTGASVVITATGVAGSFSSLTLVSGNAQTVAAGSTTAAFVVKAVDQFGNPVAGATVSWAVSGGGSLSSSSTTTDATGTTSVTLTTGAAPATYAITATSGTATPVTFTVTSM